MGIQGEGERSFVELLDVLQNNQDYSGVNSVYDIKQGIKNPQKIEMGIDNLLLPEPNKHLWTLENVTGQAIWLPIQTRRGCPMNCSYCSTPTIEGKIIRKRNIDSIVDAVMSYSDSGFDHFFFVDNTFNLPPGYAKLLCDKIVESGLKIKWRGIIYPWKIDEELVSKMADSGCAEVSLGFESGSNAILKNMNKRFDIDNVRHIFDLLKSYGIGPGGFFLKKIHTFSHFRKEFYQLQLSDRSTFEEWHGDGFRIEERANRLFKEMLNSYEEPRLPAEVDRNLVRFMDSL